MGKYHLRISKNLKMQIIGKLSGTNHHFKYIVNCIILAAGGNGMDVAGLCYWDQEMDGSVTIKWDNKHMTCIVNIFGCAIWWSPINQCKSLLTIILGKKHPFWTIFYFYVIRINLSHFSPITIFLSFLTKGMLSNHLHPYSFEPLFFNPGANPICSNSFRLK